MQHYIDEVKKIVETMPHSEHVQRLIEIIGPFYEYVNEPEPENENGQDEEEEDDIIEEKPTSNGNNMIESFDNIGEHMFDSFTNGNGMNGTSGIFKTFAPVNGTSSTNTNKLPNGNLNGNLNGGSNHPNVINSNHKHSNDLPNASGTFSSKYFGKFKIYFYQIL